MSRSAEELFPEDRFIRVPNWPVFKTHSIIKSGKKVKVTREDLEEIAANHNDKWNRLEVAIPTSEGHTLDGDVLESEQPEICGWTVNYRVGKVPDDPDEDYLFCDWYVRRDKSYVIDEFPSRSVEYFPARREFWPVSVLKSSAPELDLPILKYRYSTELQPGEEPPYRYSMTNPIPNPSESMTEDEKKDKKPEETKTPDSAKEAATEKETKGAKTTDAKIDELMKVMASLEPLIAIAPQLTQLVQLLDEEGEGGDGDGKGDHKPDLLAPPGEGEFDDEEGDEDPKGKDKGTKPAPKEDIKDDRKSNEDGPVRFDTSSPSATNSSIPSYSDKDKVKMSRETKTDPKPEVDVEKYARLESKANDLAVKYQKLYKKNRLTEAEAMVKSMETDHLIEFKTPEIRAEEVATLAELEEESAKVYYQRALVRYQKKLPVKVDEVTKYARTGDPDLSTKTPEEAQQRAEAILKSGLSVEEFYKKLAAGK